MEPKQNNKIHRIKEGEGKMDGSTFALHESADFLPLPEILDFDDLVYAPSREPFTTLW